MKKVFLVFLVLFLLVLGVSYKQILATIDFYQFQNENAAEFNQATLDWKMIPHSSSVSRGLVGESLTLDNIQFPLTFKATKSSSEDSAFALGGGKSVKIEYKDEAKDWLSNHGFTGNRRDELCDFLTETSSSGACNSNYSLYRAIMELNETDIHAFSPISHKEFYNEIVMIRVDMIPTRRVSGFETGRIRGFLFSTDQNNHVAKFFDQEDQQYDMTFTNVPEADAAFMLSGMTVKAN